MGKSKLLTMTSLGLVLALSACNGDSSEDSNDNNDVNDTEESSNDTDGSNESSSENNGDDSDDASEDSSDESSSDDTASSGEGDIYDIEDFPKTVSNTGEPTGEGTLRVGYASDTPFEGTLNYAFFQGAPDANFIGYFDESLFTFDENFQATNDGAMHYEVNEEDKTVTFTVQDDVYWHDGEPLKASDYAYSYEVIGHPDYTGVRGSSDGFTSIEGYDEYKAGEADEISGIEVVDDKTVVITYKDLSPSLTSGGFWFYAFPEHHYEGVEVADMPEAPQTRENPIGIGPYKVESITPGEAVIYSKFEDYWRGEPQLDGIEVTVINPSSIANAIENDTIDVATSYPTDQYADTHDIDGVEWLGDIDAAYSYVGFKLGTWDEEESRVNYAPEESKTGDVELRRAMWHAVDNDSVGERFYNGFRWKATSLITPYHADWHKEDLDVPEYDPEEANRILDEAGYVDVNGDGFRETPDGEELVLNFASMSGGDVAEPLTNYYIQSWRNVGLNVQLTNGRLLEFNTFYDMVQNDDEDIDIYMGAWGVGTDVDPSGFYAPDAAFNFPRYESEENTELLERGVSQEALDLDTRLEIYDEWQELMVEEIPVIPTLYRAYVVPVNERVVNWSEENGFNEDHALYRVGFSE